LLCLFVLDELYHFHDLFYSLGLQFTGLFEEQLEVFPLADFFPEVQEVRAVLKSCGYFGSGILVAITGDVGFQISSGLKEYCVVNIKCTSNFFQYFRIRILPLSRFNFGYFSFGLAISLLIHLQS